MLPLQELMLRMFFQRVDVVLGMRAEGAVELF